MRLAFVGQQILGGRVGQQVRQLPPLVAGLLVALLVLTGCGINAPAAVPPSSTITVTDVVGRVVTVKRDAQRIILGEGRQIYLVAALEPADPFRRIVGWPDDFRTTDLMAYDRYKAKFPKLVDIPIFGSPSSTAFSIEKAIEVKPDVLVLTLDSYTATQDSGLIGKLEKAGIPTVVIDFRQYPLENTVPSMLLLGKLMGKEARAQEINDYYTQQVNLVYARIGQIKGPKPSVFVYRAAGFGECCGTFGRANMGLFVERAGGENIGSALVPGFSGTLNPEQVIVSNPDKIIITGSDWRQSPTAKGYITLGYDAKPEETREQIRAVLASQPGWNNLNAAKNGQVYVIWHQFYTSPYHFAALQQIAKWLYPEEFKDLDPEQNFKEFHQKFLPIEYSGIFWAGLQP